MFPYKIPNSVKTLGSGAFDGCCNLERVSIGNGISCIEDWTFAYCFDLRDVVLGKNLRYIMNYAFYKCSDLSNVTSLSTISPVLQREAFVRSGEEPDYLFYGGDCRGIACSGLFHYRQAVFPSFGIAVKNLSYVFSYYGVILLFKVGKRHAYAPFGSVETATVQYNE